MCASVVGDVVEHPERQLDTGNASGQIDDGDLVADLGDAVLLALHLLLQIREASDRLATACEVLVVDARRRAVSPPVDAVDAAAHRRPSSWAAIRISSAKRRSTARLVPSHCQ